MLHLFARWALAIVLPALVQGCSATSSIRKAEVIVKDGRVCFAAETNDQSSSNGVQIHAFSVSGPRGELGPNGLSPLMWAFRMEKGQAPLDLRGDTCVAYGVLPPKSEQTVAPKSLQENTVYSVFLNGRPSSTASVLGYDADFCITIGRKGQIERLIVVPWDDKAQKWRYDLCAQASNN
jgi:hypothetical protein